MARAEEVVVVVKILLVQVHALPPQPETETVPINPKQREFVEVAPSQRTLSVQDPLPTKEESARNFTVTQAVPTAKEPVAM